MRTKISPVLGEKISQEKKLNSVQFSSHFACEIMIWPIRMQLMTHYRIPEMTERHRVEIEERKDFLEKKFALNISLRIF